ncbi:MAG: DUF551 domain-containing protein [Gammaproteobacteria bacterium]|nr:DUF551 domain-containing protein [Gammaproteobacteria bacterium]
MPERQQELFNYMSQEHGLLLLESEMYEIEDIVLKMQPGWISVDDRLPNTIGDYLIYTDKNVLMRAYLNRNNHWSGNGLYEYIEEVTHWMPLPKPPKELQGDK